MPDDPLPTDTAPADRFCDLVMKGGITSGVVYPLAILELARAYRFRSIGGTSAGAIAAAVTAAAELRRRQGSMAGFAALAALPASLGAPVDGQSRLLSLFQPAPTTARLFNALLAMLNRQTTGQRWLGGVTGFVRAYARPALVGLLAGLVLERLLASLVGGAAGPGTLLFWLLGGVAGIGWGVWRDLTVGLVPNGYGLCKGGPGGNGQALVPWLHQLIQQTAGRGPLDAPLTFRDLWQAPGYPPAWLKDVAPPDAHAINLQVFTTNLTHGRPYHLPLQDETSRLFFLPDELRSYFPDDVLRHLVAKACPYAPRAASDPAADQAPAGLLELPGGDLPIVVAARLSLSFPLLISAVPLWAIDYEPERGQRRLQRCWFSDGGISSNFPIHLFDGFLPMWPTFGITLGRRNPFRPDVATWLPQFHEQGRGDAWDRFDEKPEPIARLGGFLAAVVGTAQNWNDATGSRMPGVRDRVVQVRLKPDEGGLNLNMPPALITGLAGYGQDAGQKLRHKFVPDDSEPGPTAGWREHRWVRFQVLLAGLRGRLKALRVAAELPHHALPLRTQIQQATTQPPLGGDGEQALTPPQAAALDQLLTALEQAEAAFDAAAVAQPYRPVPEPSVRVRPPL